MAAKLNTLGYRCNASAGARVQRQREQVRKGRNVDRPFALPSSEHPATGRAFNLFCSRSCSLQPVYGNLPARISWIGNMERACSKRGRLFYQYGMCRSGSSVLLLYYPELAGTAILPELKYVHSLR